MSCQAKRRHGGALDAYIEVHLIIRIQCEKAECCRIPTEPQSRGGKAVNTGEIAMWPRLEGTGEGCKGIEHRGFLGLWKYSV